MVDSTYKKKLVRIIGISGWSRDKLADMMGVSNNTIDSWNTITQVITLYKERRLNDVLLHEE